MHETESELRALQGLLDTSYARAGSHLRSISGPQTRLDAAGLSATLAGAQVLDLATVTPRGEPRVAPVDGLFFRGHLWFGTSETGALWQVPREMARLCHKCAARLDRRSIRAAGARLRDWRR